MIRRFAIRKSAIVAVLSAVLLAASACHSYHIDSTIENRTGAPVKLIEVDYPDASFGADIIASGAVYHYRFQVRGSGRSKSPTPASTKSKSRSPDPLSRRASKDSSKSSFCPRAKPNSSPNSVPRPDADSAASVLIP